MDIEYYGGDQSWWEGNNTCLKKYGCGIIAMCNTELSIRNKLEKVQEETGNAPENYDSTKENIIEFSDYTEYVNERYNIAYGLPAVYPLNAIGLVPWKMVKGIKKFYEQYGIKIKVKWAPSLKKSKIINMINEMLTNGVPIPAAYYVFNKKNKLAFYTYDVHHNQMKECSSCTSHYFNITGIMNIVINNENQIYFKISTWGKLYYIKLDEWIKKLSYFSNILYIKQYKKV